MLNKVLKLLAPSMCIALYKKAQWMFDNPNKLFNGDDVLFKKILKKAQIYAEYGCGKSTKWVLNNSSAKIIAVDTSRQWVNQVITSNHTNSDRLLIKHIDVGEVGNWGRPVDYSKRQAFNEYTDFIWKQNIKPDVILIDGRFRVCCFLTSLKYAEEGTFILFDDYTNRPHYHIIEKYVKRTEEYGRQCLFVVPPHNMIDFDNLEKDINNFRHVMD